GSVAMARPRHPTTTRPGHGPPSSSVHILLSGGFQPRRGLRVRRRNTTLALGSAVVAAVTTVVAAGPPSALADLPTAQFRPGLHLTAEFPYGLVQAEPSVRVDKDGRICVAAPGPPPHGCVRE